MTTCSKCHKEVTRKIYRKFKNVYCNRVCAGINDQKKSAICRHCGEVFKFSGNHWGNYCSNECKFNDWHIGSFCNFEEMDEKLKYLDTKLKGE